MISGKYYRGVRLERCDKIDGVRGSHIELSNCYVEHGPPDVCRPTIRDVEIEHLALQNCHLTGAKLENVTINGLYLDELSGVLFANEFVNVKLCGSVDPIIVNMCHSDARLEDSYQRVLRESELVASCTLDISEAEGDVFIRGYSVDKIRRDPESQAVVRLENVLDGRWMEIDFDESAFEVTIDMMLRMGWAGVVLAANKRSASFRDEVQVIRRLRDAGVADLS